MTQFFFLGKSVIDLKNVNEALNYIDHWLKHNELFLNYTKIHYMLITKQKIPQDFNMNININYHVISKVMNVKYLVVCTFHDGCKQGIDQQIDRFLAYTHRGK